MEEKNTKNVPEKKNSKGSAKKFVNKHIGEFKKIIWPSKEELFKQTVTVICLSVIVAVIIWGYDEVFEYLYQALIILVK
ncbi:MAG: preprotein translocase subunit SecE [Clostridiales bacterium]|nr:preprotein translocase subunit SecE [Clostridiales bacterium]